MSARSRAVKSASRLSGVEGAAGAAPAGVAALLRVALKQATEANYHLSFLPQVAPWLLAYRANSTTERRTAFAHAMRPLFARALAEHEVLML